MLNFNLKGCEGFTILYEMEVKKPDYLYVKVKGKRTKESIKKATEGIVEKCQENKCSKVLVDIRDFSERINITEIFDLASKELPEITMSKINKVAIVDNEGFNYNKNFFENVARNRGHNVKIFTNIDNAMQWLS